MKKVNVLHIVIAAALLSGCASASFNGEEATADQSYSQPEKAAAPVQEGKSKVDNGVVYQNGKKGYLKADGEFVQYGQSAHKHASKPASKQASLKQLNAEASAVINGTIADGAEFLIGQGWKANQGQWHKQGYTLSLVVEDGIVKNAQLSK